MMRTLSRTGLPVSAVTLGTAALSRSADAAAVVSHALDAGIAAIELDAGDDAVLDAVRDSARGRDATLLVRATSGVVFDLPMPHVSIAQAYPGSRLRGEVERILTRLRVERIGILQLHAWCAEWLDEGDWRETAERLRQEGKIGGIGVSLFDHDVDAGLGAVGGGAVDSVQTMFNLFDTGAAINLFPAARDAGVGVIARSPLYYGTLVDAPPVGFAPNDWRAGFFFDDHLNETAARSRRIAADREPGESMAELALRFALSHPVVTTVAVGLRTPAQVDLAIAAAARGALSPDRLRRLFAHRWLC